MKTWRRAGLYILRKRGRSIVLFFLIFVMATLVFAGFAIKISADREIAQIRRKLGSSFVISEDLENANLYEMRYEEGYQYMVFTGRPVIMKLVKDVLEVDGVIDYEVSSSEIVWTNLQLKPGLWAVSEENEYTSAEEIELRRQVTNAVICDKGDANVNFRIGAFSIVQGRNIRESDKSAIVISEYLAEKNHVSVGNTVILETKVGVFQPSKTPFETMGTPQELEIVGIYKVNFEQEGSEFTPENEYADNILYIDSYTGMELGKNRSADQEQDVYSKATFFVEDPQNLEAVMKRVEKQVDLSGLIVSLDDSTYQKSVKPLRQIGIFALALLISGASGCIVILWFLLKLWIKQRMHEIGILLSIGIRRRKILWQMILEGMMITTVSLVLAIAFAPFFTNAFIRISTEIEKSDQKEVHYTINTKNGEFLPSVGQVSAEDVKLANTYTWIETVFSIVLIYGCTFLSTLLSSVKIMRLSPIMILQSK